MNKLHNAEVSLELCRDTLTHLGQRNASMALRGLELPNVEAAYLAHVILNGITVFGNDAGQAKAHALQALEQLISAPTC